MITGERIRLRAIERTDLPLFVDWLNDPEVIAGLDIYRPFSSADEDVWYEAMLKTHPDEHPFVIEAHGEEGEWVSIGNIGLHSIEWRVRSAELGIIIGIKSYWNKGYGSEAVRLMLCYAFDTLNLNRIFLRVFAHNLRAIRSYEKVGFVQEGRLRQSHFYTGKAVDTLVMSVLREEYLIQTKR
jgi:RimJ/RimL family protein N-acetyltransferase